MKIEHKKQIETDYKLRSSFFDAVISNMEIRNMIKKIHNVESASIWSNVKSFGISEAAWKVVVNKRIKPEKIFAHPEWIQKYPSWLLYYRNLAVIPQKGVKKMVYSSIDKVENGIIPKNFHHKINEIIELYNSSISFIIETSIDFSEDSIEPIIYSSIGSAINGSWLNKIGEQAELSVKRIIVKCILEKKIFENVVFKNGAFTNNLQEIEMNMDFIKEIKMKNKRIMYFTSEPDVYIKDETDITLLSVEIKGGKDKAGALERYGAAKKSFEEVRKENAKVETILVTNCMTKEVEKRIQKDMLIDKTYELEDMMQSEHIKNGFIEQIERYIV